MKPIILTVCAVVLMASAGWAGSLVTNESGNVEAELRDGSKLIGTAVPATLALDVKTEALGQLSIPLNRIGKIEFTKDGQVSIQLQNGDKLKGEVQLRALKLQTVVGLLSVPREAIVKLQVRAASAGSSRLLGVDDWDLLPFPQNSNWPGERGEPATLGADQILLRSQPIRTRHAHRLPQIVTGEITCLGREDGCGWFNLYLVPAGQSPVLDPSEALVLVLNLGPSQSAELQQRTGRGAYQILWRSALPSMAAGDSLHVRLEIGDGKALIKFNDQPDNVANVRLTADEYHLELWSWPPTSQWTVRKVSIQ